MIDKKYSDFIVQFKKINGKISYLRIKNNIANVTIVNVYAPAEEQSEEENNAFY